jgi:hypothetical protein
MFVVKKIVIFVEGAVFVIVHGKFKGVNEPDNPTLY